MDVRFSNSFFKSLKKLRWHNSFIYKSWDLFRYDIPGFFSNIWKFRKSLWRFRWWDDTYPLMMFKNSLEIMAPKFEKNGMEIKDSRFKKVAMMKRAILLMDNFIKDSFIDQAESELGTLSEAKWDFKKIDDGENCELIDGRTEEESNHDRNVFKRAREIEEEQWKELWKIIIGQDESVYINKLKEHANDNYNPSDLYSEVCDGSGLRSWWD